MFDRIDKAADTFFDRYRGRRGPDAAAAALSNLADYGIVWVVLAGGKGRRRGDARRRAAEALTYSGIVSFGVNKVVKTVVQRERPENSLQLGSVAGPAAEQQQLPERPHARRVLDGRRAADDAGRHRGLRSVRVRPSRSAGSTSATTTPATSSAARPSAPPSASSADCSSAVVVGTERPGMSGHGQRL